MLNFSNKNVLWIFSHPKPQTIPSYLVSGIYPANYLGIQKVIFLENLPENLVGNYGWHNENVEDLQNSDKFFSFFSATR